MTLYERWTFARVVHLETRWAEGVTATAIAEELNRLGLGRHEEKFTKNSVIGRVHRMGLVEHGHKGHTERPDGEVKVRKPRPSRAKVRRKPVEAPLAPKAPIVRLAPPRRRARLPRPPRGPVGLMKLSDGLCRWPVGEDAKLIGRYIFCGKTVEARQEPSPHASHQYCREHAEACYQHHGVPR